MDKVVPDEVKRLLLSLQQNRARAYAAAGHPLDTHGHIHLEQDALAKYHGMLRTVQAEIIAPYGDTVNAVDFIAAAKEELIMSIRRYLESYGEIDPTCCDECKELYGMQQTIKILDALQKEGK